MELPGGLGRSLPHPSCFPCHLRLGHRPQGPEEELGGGLNADEAEAEQHVRGAQLLPRGEAYAPRAKSPSGTAAVPAEWLQPSRIPRSFHLRGRTPPEGEQQGLADHPLHGHVHLCRLQEGCWRAGELKILNNLIPAQCSVQTILKFIACCIENVNIETNSSILVISYEWQA